MKRRFSHNITSWISSVCGVSLMVMSASCGNDSSKASGSNTILMSTDSIMVKDSITDHAGIKILSSLRVEYPSKFNNSRKDTKQIQSLIYDVIFGTKETDILKVVRGTVKDRLDTYSLTEDNAPDETLEDETAPISRYDLQQSVSQVFHSYDFLCLVKCSTTSKDRKPSMSSKLFYSFDLIGKKRITVADIFPDNNIPKVNALLKQKLLTAEKCSNSDQLADVGYFNADNLSVTDNFYLSDSGITFHFNPLEIACYAVGDVDISIPYSELKQYVSDQSPINRIIK